MYKRIGIRNRKGHIVLSPSPFERTTRGFYLNVTKTDLPAPDPDTATLFIEVQEYDRVSHQEQVLKPVHCLGVYGNDKGVDPELITDHIPPFKVVPYDKVRDFHIENLLLTFGVEVAEDNKVLEVPKLRNGTLWHAACLIVDPKHHKEMWEKCKGDDYEERLWNYIGSEVSNGSCQATGWTPDKKFINQAVKFRKANPLPNNGNPAVDALEWITKWDETL